MSRNVKKMVCCPHCHTETPAQLWPSVNVTQTPQLRDSVMDESLFSFCCNHCGHSAQLNYPLLYHDKTHKFMVYCIPQLDRTFYDDQQFITNSAEFIWIRRRLVSDLNELTGELERLGREQRSIKVQALLHVEMLSHVRERLLDQLQRIREQQ